METNSNLRFSRTSDNTLLICFAGDWKLSDKLPEISELKKQIETPPQVRRIAFDTKDLKGWDSGLLTFLIKVFDNSAQGNINVEKDGLPEWVKRLLHLAYAVSERKGARRGTIKIPFLEQVANISIGGWHSFIDMLGFIGEASMAFMKLLGAKPVSDVPIFSTSSWKQDDVDVYRGNDVIAEYRLKTFEGGVDLGILPWSYGEVRIGYAGGILKPKLQTGTLDISDDRINMGGIHSPDYRRSAR